MATKIEEVRQQASEARERIREERAKYDEDNLPTTEDVARLEALVNAEADIKDTLATAERGLGIQAGDRANPTRSPATVVGRATAQSLGDMFVDSQQYSAWRESNVGRDGRIPTQGQVPNSSPYRLDGGLLNLGQRAGLFTGGSDTSAGAFIVNDRTSIYNVLGRRPLDVIDIIRKLDTGSDLVEFVRQSSRTNSAAAVAEATAASGSSGAKPESDAAFAVVQTSVQTIANWMPVTRQAIADAPQLRGIIDTELRDNLRETLEAEVVNGDGTPGFTGIFQTTNTQTQAWDTNILTTTRKARTLVGTVGRTVPTAYVLHPTQWEGVDLLQDNEARYYYGGPMAMGIPRLWGLPVVECESMPSGYGLVGNFEKAVLWDREQAAILISDSHSDFFIRNLIALLAEGRWAFGVIQPNAFVEIDVVA